MRPRTTAVVALLCWACTPRAETNLVWRTAHEDLAIGGDSDDPRYIFGRVADVAVDSRGRIYALDQQAQEIKVYEADGAFVHTVAGPGRGPGNSLRISRSTRRTTASSEMSSRVASSVSMTDRTMIS